MYFHLTKPHEAPMFNRLEFINEYCILALAFTMLLFSGIDRPVSDVQNKTGKSVFLIFLFFIYIVNILTLLRVAWLKISQYTKAYAVKNQKCLCFLSGWQIKEIQRRQSLKTLMGKSSGETDGGLDDKKKKQVEIDIFASDTLKLKKRVTLSKKKSKL